MIIQAAAKTCQGEEWALVKKCANPDELHSTVRTVDGAAPYS